MSRRWRLRRRLSLAGYHLSDRLFEWSHRVSPVPDPPRVWVPPTVPRPPARRQLQVRPRALPAPRQHTGADVTRPV